MSDVAQKISSRLRAMAQDCIEEANRLKRPGPWDLRRAADLGGPAWDEKEAERRADLERLAGRIYADLARALDGVVDDLVPTTPLLNGPRTVSAPETRLTKCETCKAAIEYLPEHAKRGVSLGDELGDLWVKCPRPECKGSGKARER